MHTIWLNWLTPFDYQSIKPVWIFINQQRSAGKNHFHNQRWNPKVWLSRVRSFYIFTNGSIAFNSINLPQVKFHFYSQRRGRCQIVQADMGVVCLWMLPKASVASCLVRKVERIHLNQSCKLQMHLSEPNVRCFEFNHGNQGTEDSGSIRLDMIGLWMWRRWRL